jgi:hypothetical protein
VQTFYLGAHRYNWACDGQTDQPLFISDRTLRRRSDAPFEPSVVPIGIDSGGFTEVSQNRHWSAGAFDYAMRVRRYMAELGNIDFVAQQDWMCEPGMLALTRMSVRQHQQFTINNYLTLRDTLPEAPWAPTIQGWTIGEYYDHIEQWYARGVELHKLDRVCVGSVCRRENPITTALILNGIASEGIRVHAFGVKAEVLELCADAIVSSDSMAWSTHMRAERNGAKKKGLPFEHFDPNSLQCALGWVEKTINPAIAASSLDYAAAA